MADSCSQLSSEISALRAAVANIKSVDENAIVQRVLGAVQPQIEKVNVLAKQALSTANDAQRNASQALTAAKSAEADAIALSNQAEVAAKHAQNTADEALNEIAALI